MNSPAPTPSQPAQLEPDYEALKGMLACVEGGDIGYYSDHIVLMSSVDEDTLAFCSPHFREKFWTAMIGMDTEEALNYRWKFADERFGGRLLRKLALEDPELIIDRSEADPENTTYQKLRRFLIRELGWSKVAEMIQARNNAWHRRLFRRILGMPEPLISHPGQIKESLPE